MKTRSDREMDRLQRMYVRRRALARWHLRLVRIYTESMERVNREIGRIAREAEAHDEREH